MGTVAIMKSMILLFSLASAKHVPRFDQSHAPMPIGNNSDLAWLNETDRFDDSHGPMPIFDNPDLQWMYETQPDDRALNDCVCAAASNRIVGGSETTPKYSLPYQIYFSANGYMCGGTIINKRYVITAMHCLFDQFGVKHPVEKTAVIAGEHNVCDGPNEGGQVIKVEKYIERDDYNTRTLANDIAILKLKSDIKFTANIKPACIATDTSKDYANFDAIISGWGGTVGYEYGAKGVQQKTSCVMKSSSVKILSPSTDSCKRETGGDSSRKMCAFATRTDTCQGDSGGPLVVKENGKFVLVGVVSYGRGCASTNPGVYARVTNYLDWIRTNTADGGCGNKPTEPVTTQKPATTQQPATTQAPTDTTNDYYYYFYY